MSQPSGGGKRLPRELYKAGLGLTTPNIAPSGRPSEIRHHKIIDLTHEEIIVRRANTLNAPAKSHLSVDGVKRKTDIALQIKADETGQHGRPPIFADARLGPDRHPIANAIVPLQNQKVGSVIQLEKDTVPFPIRSRSLPTDCDQPGLKKDTAFTKSMPVSLPEAFKRDVRFTDGGSVDCCMWTGEHDEDRLSEQAIRIGYSVKTHVVNESNTAKPSLWPHFKNKSGLHALSSLLVSVIQQRQNTGLVTSNSMFKPPPRVTSTDGKREGWLCDLANEAIPLRRLSRTIPHGIRGSALLEQCLAKNIPVRRAVWLAKCVGANEIRAFKRKGVSGAVMVGHELKWIEDWTTLVELFLKSAIDCCRRSASREKLTYTIQLCWSFYTEHLLDHNHWMSWLLRYFEECTSAEIPTSLLLMQIYWKDLISTMRTGRRLALLCFAHLKRLSLSMDENLISPFAQRLKDVVRNLVVSRPSCIVLPSMWKDYRPFLQSMQEIAGYSPDVAFRYVLERNDRLNRYFMTRKTPHHSILTMLDRKKGDVNIEELSFQCMSVLPDVQELITVLLRWASTVYREGPYKTYIVARILRHLAAKGIDIEQAILPCLALLRVVSGLRPAKIGRLLAELVRTRDFDVGHYLRWLLATGALNAFNGDSSRWSCDVRFLVDIPTHDLPGSIVSLRRSLLRYIGMNVLVEAQVIDTIKQHIVLQLPHLFPLSKVNGINRDHIPPVILSEISTTIAFEISRWLQESIGVRPFTFSLNQSTNSVSNNVAHIITTHDLQHVCSIVEELGDFHALANILRIEAESSAVDMLLLVIDKADMHHGVLLAIGAMGCICQTLFEQYRTLKHRGTLCKELILALMHLSAQLPLEGCVLPYFKQELISLNQSLGLAACTPASDNTPENTLNINSEVEDEIEGIASSGARIDYQTCNRLFKKIALDLEKSKARAMIHYRTLATPVTLFGILRDLDEDMFDRVMLQWLSEAFQGLTTSDPGMAVPALINTGYVSFARLVDCVEKAFEEQDVQTVAKVATKLLALLVPGSIPPLRGSMARLELDSDPLGSTTSHEVHKFYMHQRAFCTQHRRILLRILCQAMPCSTLTFDHALISILRQGFVNNVQEVIHELDFAMPAETPIILANWSHLMEKLVDPNDDFGFSNMSAKEIVSTIFMVVNDLSLPFCQFGLSYIVITSRLSRNTVSSFTETIINASKAAIARACPFWPDLISVLGQTIGRSIREYAEMLLLSDEIGTINSCAAAEASYEAQLQRYLKVVDATASSIPDGGDPRIASTIIAQTSLIVQQVRHFNGTRASLDKGLLAILQCRIYILLQLSAIHISSFHPTICSPSSRTIHLTNLSTLLVYSSSYFSLSTLDHIYDIAATFTIDLTASEFSHLSKTLDPMIKNDSRIRFLFGFRTDPSSWLHMSSQQQPQQQPQVAVTEPKSVPFTLRHWELLQDSTPNIGANDTALSLRLFGARKV